MTEGSSVGVVGDDAKNNKDLEKRVKALEGARLDPRVTALEERLNALLFPKLQQPSYREINRIHNEDADGFVVAFVRFSGVEAGWGQAGLVGHLSDKSSTVDDQLHKVAWSHANASHGTQACTIMFPVPKGWYYKVEGSPWVERDPVAVISFFPLR